MNYLRIYILLVLTIWILPPTADALQDSKHPIIDQGSEEYKAPLDLNALSLKQLLEYRKLYHQELQKLNKLITDKKNPKLTEVLIAYDTSRLKIVEMIPKLIEAYSLDGSIKKDLLTYSNTFSDIRSTWQQIDKVSLSDYRAYDFRLGISYQSMLYFLSQNDALYQKIQKDMQNKNTVIGAYINELNTAYTKVEAVNADKPEYFLIRQIEGELKRVQNEINQR